MPKQNDEENAADVPERVEYKVLLGWNPSNIGERVSLRLQTLDADGARDKEVSETLLFLSKTQAIQLADSLFHVTGETAPTRRKAPLIDRLFTRK